MDKWCADHKPDDLSVRRVLAQVVTALAHLHGLGIVHADVKPGNILMDKKGFARLGDFDVSVDSNTRTSAARAHATMTQVGFTPGFAAPELLRTGASPASDIFALGATIAEVAPRSEDRDILLQRLQALDPMARPRAPQVLQDPFFAPVFAWARDERRACCICLEDGIRLEEGLECGRANGEPHFVCRQCLEQHVEATVGAELRLRQANEGRVCCPGRPCDAAAYPDVDLAKRVNPEVFQRYTESRLDLLEQRRAAELEGEMQVRLGNELRRLQALDEQQRRVRAVRNHICEDMLNLKCPRCGQVFLDFVGCFALQCSRCPCGFCAWCGADSGGSNAHEHVRNCREKPPGADVFFGTFEQFEVAQRRRRRRLLLGFLPTLDVHTRAAVLQEMRRELADLGMADIVGPHVVMAPGGM
uniref:Protein kinase domain-containing protein n=1 Tax=Alexandrium catenella TaxID=2925 RepID=A0A7S1MF13_ALECA